jgi:hypothetical protein
LKGDLRMLAQDNSINLFGESYFFKSNDPLLLDNPETIWLVKSGSLALFAINVQHGIPKGRRRYLFSVKMGEAMFSATFTSSNGQYQILAIALEETELIQVTSNPDNHLYFPQSLDPTPTPPRMRGGDKKLGLFGNSEQSIKISIEQIECWVNHLGSTVSEITSKKMPTPGNTPGCTILAEEEVFQPPHDSVIWVQISQGQANLLGLDGLEITSSMGRIPLNSRLWLQSRDIIGIDSILTADILKTSINSICTGLGLLQIFVLQAIEQLEQRAIQQELVRCQERERLNNQAIANTLDDFANIFDVQKTNVSGSKQALNNDEALLFAAGAVGRVLGITISPPANSEDLRRVRDPLEAIARASRIRIRRITLRDKWWGKDSGPILAHTLEDNRPVAVIPIDETHYDIIDPLQQTRVRCNNRTAATLSPTAYTFYRPLPETLNVMSLLSFALKGHSKELFTLLLAGIATTLLGMVAPQAMAILIDQAIPDAGNNYGCKLISTHPRGCHHALGNLCRYCHSSCSLG